MTIEISLPRPGILLAGALAGIALLSTLLWTSEHPARVLEAARFMVAAGSLLLVSGIWSSWGDEWTLRKAKEFRLLLPGTLLAVVVPTFPFHWFNSNLALASIPAYFIGCGMLGVAGLSREFEHRAMSFMLAQPLSRSRILIEKLLPAGLLLLVAWAQMMALILQQSFHGRWPGLFQLMAATSFLWIAPVLAICSGPWWALLMRRTLPAVALLITLPAVLSLAVAQGASAYYAWRFPDLAGTSDHTRAVNLAVLALFVLYLMAGAVAGWWKFSRLALTEGAGISSGTAAALAPLDQALRGLFGQSSMMVLLRKEIRLQAPAFLAAAALLVLWGLWMTGRYFGAAMLLAVEPDLVRAAVLLAAGGIMVLAGAVTVAEEREMGTLDWQLTQPVAVSRQWWIKTVTAALCAICLGVALPVLLLHLSQTTGLVALGRRFTVCFFACLPVAVYFSSICRAALSATVLSALFAPVLAAVVGAVILFLSLGGVALENLVGGMFQHATMRNETLAALVLASALLMVAVASTGFLLFVSSRNYRNPPATTLAAATQVMMVFGLLLAGFLVIASLSLIVLFAGSILLRG